MMNQETVITHDILLKNGFEKRWKFMPVYIKKTDNPVLKIDLDLIEQLNQAGEVCSVRIANDKDINIGSAYLSTVEQYNSLMDVFRCAEHMRL